MARACKLLLLLPVCLGCDLPRDPEGTLPRVRGGTLRVGITEQEPWTRLPDDEEPGGLEVELVRQFARDIDAEVEWVRGSEAELFEALEHFELDLVIGGLTEHTPWSSRVGLTAAYVTTRSVIGVPEGTTPPEELHGETVAVPGGRAMAARVRQQNGNPVAVRERRSFDGLVAGDEYELRAWGYQPSSIELHKEKHVMAVAPGENGFLVRLEKFLLGREAEIRAMLAKEVQP